MDLTVLMDIDVEHLARLMNMSRATFHRKVKALSNLTPHELINITRLQKAARLLADGDYRVYEVAAIVISSSSPGPLPVPRSVRP